jgi:hypothetical protein
MENLTRPPTFGAFHCESRESDMLERSDPPDNDILQGAVAESLVKLLSRNEYRDDPAEVLRTLRCQLAQVLAEAPTRGSIVDQMNIRAHLASVFEAEISRLEEVVRSAAMGLRRASAFEEKRRWPRHQVRLRAQLVSEASAVDCIVVDLSEGGAQVRTTEPIQLPDEVVLRVEDGATYRASLRWMDGAHAGFEFCSASSVGTRP